MIKNNLYILRFVYAIAFSFQFCAYAQIDSLEKALVSCKTDTGKASICFALSKQLMHENTPESFSYVYKGLKLSEQQKYDKGIGEAYYLLGNLHDFNSVDSSIYYLKQALSIKTKLKDLKGVASVNVSIGTCYDKSGNSEMALKYYLTSLKQFESLKLEKGIASAALGVGNIFMTIKNYNKSIEFYQKAIDNYKKIKSPYVSWAINNLASVYEKLNKIDEAKALYEESLKLKLDNKDFYGAVFSIDNVGLLLNNEGKYKEALIYFQRALEINREYNLEKETFANSYKNIAQVCLARNDNALANLYLDSFKVVTDQINMANLKLSYLKLKSQYFENINDYKNALLCKNNFIQLNDSFLTVEMHKQVAEADAKYKTEKKQREIDGLQKDKVIQDVEIKRQNSQKIGFIIGIIFLVILIVFVTKNYHQKQKANILITKQKQEVEIKNHIIEEKQKEILDSIHYAKRIQTTLLANKELVNSHLTNNFILFKPKDIVSGDFYWATEHNNKFYLAVCDCTGHGVPGAFMSLLNIGFLSEAIKEKNIEEPGDIFNYVRKRLINSISNDEQKDGMDGILLCIDKGSKIATYTASNNEPILISNNKITELAKDKMPVGKGETTVSFTTHTINANSGDTLYLYTDGYADQFGGPKGKKLKYKTLNELLLKHVEKIMNEQAEILNIEFENWRGNLEQVDDVCIVGIKL